VLPCFLFTPSAELLAGLRGAIRRVKPLSGLRGAIRRVKPPSACAEQYDESSPSLACAEQYDRPDGPAAGRKFRGQEAQAEPVWRSWKNMPMIALMAGV
jgi:hypothetical protein